MGDGEYATTRATRRITNPSGANISDNTSAQTRAKTYAVVINGTPHTLDDEIVNYEDLGALAFPGHDPASIFTVAYKGLFPDEGVVGGVR